MPMTMERVMLLDQHGSDDETHFGAAVAAELRRLHPYNTSGLVAQRLRCSKAAAENILSGHLSARSITRLTKAYGLGFMIEVSAAVAGETLEQFIRNRARTARQEAEELAALEAAMEAILVPRQTAENPVVEPSSWDRRGP